MILGKGAYLRQLTAATMQMKSVVVGKEMNGSSPPSVFIGRLELSGCVHRADDRTHARGYRSYRTGPRSGFVVTGPRKRSSATG